MIYERKTHSEGLRDREIRLFTKLQAQQRQDEGEWKPELRPMPRYSKNY
jgi:hypothetical protein